MSAAELRAVNRAMYIALEEANLAACYGCEEDIDARHEMLLKIVKITNEAMKNAQEAGSAGAGDGAKTCESIDTMRFYVWDMHHNVNLGWFARVEDAIKYRGEIRYGSQPDRYLVKEATHDKFGGASKHDKVIG
jgi:hypothetical protein